MIIEFSVRNFRSFSTEQRLSFRAASHAGGGLGTTPRLNNSAIVFGPNGAGKSNLLRALRTMREFVLCSTSFSESDIEARYTPFQPRRLDDEATVLTIDMILGGMRYCYGFAYNMRRILSEQLRVFRTHKAQRWFDRRYDAAAETERWSPFSSFFFGQREAWRSATKPQALFLTTAGTLGAELLALLLNWFEHQLVILLSAECADMNHLARRLRDAAIKRSILGILRAVDGSVVDVRVQTSPAVRGTAASSGPSIEFLHVREGAEPVWADSIQHSTDALWLILVVLALLDDAQSDKLIAIDDFDSHVHPIVARFLMQAIEDLDATKPAAQIIISQSTTLLDLEWLQRHELWLMESDDDHASRLKPLLAHGPKAVESPIASHVDARSETRKYSPTPAAGRHPRQAAGMIGNKKPH
jgi:hypothetical protein